MKFIHTNSWNLIELHSRIKVQTSHQHTYRVTNHSITKSKKLSSILVDIDVRPLSISDASIVDDNWTFQSEFSLIQIQYEITHFPAFGIFKILSKKSSEIEFLLGAYRKNELLSWALTKYDASVGSVFTKPEARGLGLGTLTNLHVASKLLETQDRSFCFVAADNISSIKMVEKLGYHHVFNVDWLVFFTSK